MEFEVNNQKNGEFTGDISFTNNGEQFHGWEVEFDAKFEIDKIWNAEIVSHKGDSYVIKDVSSNDNVFEGETTTFGFSANGETIEPSNFVFNGQAIDVEVEEEIESTPSSPTPSPTTSPTPSPTSISRPNYNKSEGFFTLDGKLYDANGNEFIPRGINNLHVYYDDNNDNKNQAYDALDNIASFGFNSVRIVWEVNFLARPTNDDMLEQIIQRTIDLNMVPVVEIHDFTGSTDKQALLNEGVKWWTDRADLWQKYEKYLIIDIANEFGNHAMAHQGDRREFANIYKEAINRIRNAGIDNTLVVEPFEWAKDYTLIRDYGQEIYNHDPQKNVLFSPHLYCGHGESSAKIKDMFDSLTGKELPFMVGEFAHEHPKYGSGGGNGDVQEQTIMSEAQEHGIGHYAWAWLNGLFSVAGHWEANSRGELTSWGEDLVFNDPNGISATSEVASIFE